MSSSLTTYGRGFGKWIPGTKPPAYSSSDISTLLQSVRERLWIIKADERSPVGIALGGSLDPAGSHGADCVGVLPPLYPEWLGSRSFLEAHRTRFAYIAGEMATGIATPAIVIAMARAGMLGFYGAAGQPI